MLGNDTIVTTDSTIHPDQVEHNGIWSDSKPVSRPTIEIIFRVCK